MTVVEHLEELRRVIIISFVATFIMAVVCLVFADRVLEILLDPVTRTGNQMVYIGLTEALITKILISIFLGFLAALPVILWQFWGFIIPALHKIERIYFTIFIALSYILFIAGIGFGFFGVYGLGVKFLLGFGGEELLPMITIGKYVSFTLMFLMPFGLVFELPLAAFFLSKLGFLTYKFMIKSRKYAILISVIISAAIVPTPDMLTPLLMATPMYLLYEFSAQIVRFVEWQRRRKAKKEAEKEGRTLEEDE
ncbi:twin-arginine translocase subunit TatC [Desulfofalx alkaliphila]|uniref:twin-arginine translocase subunit TatC n=1 Tax=Desulfofalx alkaliphila TaxID=105483 RepID=UPI0004E1F2D8|nr:twin-arginine translocase subunit TatC [Desulfofalx alkaliphila]